MTTEEARRRVAYDQDFIALKRFDYSLAKLLFKHPEGVPDRVIAQALMMSEDDVEDTYLAIVAKLQQSMRARVEAS